MGICTIYFKIKLHPLIYFPYQKFSLFHFSKEISQAIFINRTFCIEKKYKNRKIINVIININLMNSILTQNITKINGLTDYGL